MKSQGYFTKVDNELLRSGKIKPHELAVFLNIKSRQGNKISAWPSHATIARETSMSVSKVKSCIKWLEANELVRVKKRIITPGRWTSNEYMASNLLVGHSEAGGRSPGTYKEDSVQEDSNANSSNTSNKRIWSHLNPDKPATGKQLEYLDDLISEFGEPDSIFNGEGEITWAGMSQTEADQWIEMYFIHKRRTELYG